MGLLLGIIVAVAVIIVLGALLASNEDAGKSFGPNPVGSPDGGLDAAGQDAGPGTGPVGSTTHPCPGNPPYEPARWNSPPVINSTRNCFAYAANDPDGHPPGKPQPGQHCGHPFTSVDCASVGAGAVCDGMTPAPNPPPSRPGYYPVALVMDPGVDYHWYRQDSNGFWSHKPGSTPAQNLDASGNPITNPQTANRDYSATGGPKNSVFCGYYYVPDSGVRTGPP